MTTAETKSASAEPTKSTASGASPSSNTDDEEWSAGTDFDKLEKEASKIFALWELAGSDVAPPDVAPPDVAPPDVAPPDVAPPDVAPLDVAPPDVAPPDVARPHVPAPDGPAAQPAAETAPTETGPAVTSAPQPAPAASADAEAWSAGDPSLSTQPDPLPAVALPAMPEAAPLAGGAEEKKPAQKGRAPNKTLPAGSLAVPPPTAPVAVVAAPVAVVAGPVVEAPVATSIATGSIADPAPVTPAAADPTGWTAAAAPAEVPARSSTPEVPLDSIIIAPDLRDSFTAMSVTAIDAKPLRISQTPDTVIDAKPLPKHEPVRARTVVDPEPAMGLPTRSNAPVLIALGAGLVLLLAVGGYYVFGRGDAPVAMAPVTPPVGALVAPVAPLPVVAAPPVAVPPTLVPPQPLAVEAPVVEAPAVIEAPAVLEAPAAVLEAVVAPPAPATRVLRVRVEPSGASVTVDGQPIAVPYEMPLLEGSDHVVVASLDGYGTETERVSLRRDATVSMRLDRIRERASSSSGSTPRIGSRIRRGGSGSGGSASGGSSVSGSGSGTSSGSGTFVTESPY